MPGKRVVVHTSCVACGAPMPLGGVFPSVTCAACGNRGDLPHDAWRWVLEDEARTVMSGEIILGETLAADPTCPRCQHAFVESSISVACSSNATEVGCAQCGARSAMRVMDGRALIGEGEGTAVAASAGAIDVACSSCGAKLSVDGSTPTPTCAFCNTRNVLPRDVWERMHPPGRVHPFYVWTHRRPVELLPERTRARSGVLPVVVGVAALAALAGFVVMRKTSRSRASAPVIAAIGAPCSAGETSCSTDGKAMLQCDSGSLQVALTCKGPKGCRPIEHGTSVSCDYTYADPDDACNVSDFACSTDGKSELRCDGSKFVVASPCGGPDACTVSPSKNGGYSLRCDTHIAPLGAPCLDDGHFACTPDGKSQLRCARGHFTLAMTCKGAGGCKISKNRVDDTTTVACDGDLSDVGDPCRPDVHACTLDGKSLLACKDGLFAIDRGCPRGCAPSATGLDCR
ncbi:MAG TPA: hypothetical protein VGH28_32125 [Polyangiaceae bacterium]